MSVTVTDQNWTARTGFTSDPATRYLMHELKDNSVNGNFIIQVWFQYSGYSVNVLAGVHTFTIPLPLTVPDLQQTILGGSLTLNFNPTALNLLTNQIVIPEAAASSSTSITITIPGLLAAVGTNRMNGQFVYSLGSPLASFSSQEKTEEKIEQ